MSALSKEEIDLFMALLKKIIKKAENINKSCLNHNQTVNNGYRGVIRTG